jgi:hypothetical protein
MTAGMPTPRWDGCFADGDFARARVVVDLGGGEGSLVAGVLLAHPGLRGIVYDLAGGLAQTRPYLGEHHVLDRCEWASDSTG